MSVQRFALAGLAGLALGAAACTFDPSGAPISPDRPDDDVLHPGLDKQRIRVESAAFMMGCNPAVVAECDTDEMPYHGVALPAYLIDRNEVTQSDYQRCIFAGACTPPVAAQLDTIDSPDDPVVGVTWYQAAAFCAWLGGRLPSEAEWEHAARGRDGRVWPWGAEPPTCDRANFEACGGATRLVGSAVMGHSPLGARDMAGNAAEWVADWYDEDEYWRRAGPGGSGTVDDPRGPPAGVAKIFRGGSFASGARTLRTSYRGAWAPSLAKSYLGFRCARDVDTTPGVD
jgi:formylglycine-generating enzyme required for sulfatase activity